METTVTGLRLLQAETLRGGITCLVALAVTVLPNYVSGESVTRSSWTQWRGPQRTSTIPPRVWPVALSGGHLKQQWTTELGPSYSGPLVSSSSVYVTATRDKKFEVVRALDRSNGQPIWEASWEGALSVPFFAKSNGDWIRATPALDGDRLFVAGMRDRLVCLHAQTGKELWNVDFVEEFGSKVPSFGFVSSPLVMGDHVYVQAGSGFVKLHKRTGQVEWRVLDDGGGMFGSAFSSPYATQIGGQRQILVQTRKELAGVEPDGGEVLWKQEVPAFRGMNILTPVVHRDSVFTSAYGGRSFLFRLTRGQDNWNVEEAWQNKVQGYMSSPVIIKGHVYLHLRNQRFTCIDLATGEGKWTTKPFGEYWSMVASGDMILALDQKGELLLIRANPKEFELVDRQQVTEDSWAHLAVCDDEVFVRSLSAMTVYRWR